MSYKEINTTITNCIYGNIKFLYLSPERLDNKIIKHRLQELNINLITIDEAHCISEWGHNFRPAYRRITKIREIHSEAPVLALTATATKNVILDIQNNLNFKQHNIVKSSFIRKNISYVVDNSYNKKKKLLKLVGKIKSSVIVYVKTRRIAEETSVFLNGHNYPANYYHAGLDIIKRKEVYKKWFHDQERIMVATSAFGMGIDKANVRLVIHTYLPATTEQFFQESGRAGRDEQQAYSFLLANEHDIAEQKKTLNKKYPRIKEIKIFYQKIANFLQIAENEYPEESIPFDILSFSRRNNLNLLEIYNIFQYLEKEEYIKMIHNDSPLSKIIMTINKSELYKFQISNRYYNNFIKLLLRLYPDIFNKLTTIKESDITKKYQSNTKEIIRLFNKLQQLEVIKYQKNNFKYEVIFLQPRNSLNNLHLNEKKWEERRNLDFKKLDYLSQFILSENKCRSTMLLNYFDEYPTDNCGKCDYCIKEKNNKISEETFKDLKRSIKDNLLIKEMSIEEIHNCFPKEDSKKITDILQLLFENDKVNKLGNKYKWNEDNI